MLLLCVYVSQSSHSFLFYSLTLRSFFCLHLVLLLSLRIFIRIFLLVLSSTSWSNCFSLIFSQHSPRIILSFLSLFFSSNLALFAASLQSLSLLLSSSTLGMFLASPNVHLKYFLINLLKKNDFLFSIKNATNKALFKMNHERGTTGLNIN